MLCYSHNVILTVRLIYCCSYTLLSEFHTLNLCASHPVITMGHENQPSYVTHHSDDLLLCRLAQYAASM